METPAITEEQKAFQDDLNKQITEKITNEFKALKAELVEKKSLTVVEDKIAAIEKKSLETKTEEQYKKVVDEITQMGLQLKSMQEKPAEQKPAKNWQEALKDAVLEKKSEIDNILAGKQDKPLRLELKSAITMTDLASIEAVGSASHYSLTSNTGIISTLRKRILKYLGAVSVGGLSVDRPYAMWIEELDEQGTPIFIGEGDLKTQLSVRYEEREKKARKIAVFGKISMEMLRFLPQLVSYIQNNMIKRMDIKTEDQLFNGDDTGNNLKGLLPYSTLFDGGVGVTGGPGLVGNVANANYYDVIRALALQVENSYGIPTKVFVIPEIVAQMELLKDNEGRYLLPPFKSANGTTIAGIEIVSTVALNGTGFDFVGGDLSVVNVQFLEQANIQIGLDGNDFTHNLKTILVEQMLVQFVSANDTKVIVKGVFADSIQLINKV